MERSPTPLSESSNMDDALEQPSSEEQPLVKLPHTVFETVFAFPPNRDTMGGTAYLILESSLGNSSNILVDCPAWNQANQEFIQAQGGIRWLFLTHRGAIARVREIQQRFGCEILLQEQEAYLLPGLKVTSFQQEFCLSSLSQAIWTAGHSPGSACLHHSGSGGILFSGRHLLPNPQGELMPLRTAKTFHWRRQIQNVQKLRDRFTADTLHYFCPGANTGFLRGNRLIDQAYERLMAIDLDACLQAKPML